MTSDPDAEIEASRLVIRGARADDLPAIEALIRPFVEERRLLPRTTAELHELLPTGFIAFWDGQIAGFAALEIYSPKLAELRSLAVLDAFRGRGIGRALVKACLDLAQTRQIFEVMVITSEDPFFQACGFDFTLPDEKKALFFVTRDLP